VLNIKKAQASFEFLSVYTWVFLGVVIVIGVMTYFNLFDPDQYISEECNIGQNIICDTWNVQKITTTSYEMNLVLKNNLEKSITPNNLTLYNSKNQIMPYTISHIKCPIDSPSYNWTSFSETSFIYKEPGSKDYKWRVGRTCLLDIRFSSTSLIQGEKEEFKIALGFQRYEGVINHTVTGRVRATIQ
jgi:uncharacterized protein (UPF0333 family)